MKKHLFLSLLASAMVFTACEISISLPTYNPSTPGVPNNTKKTFWAQDVRNNSYYALEAEQLAKGNYCTVWVETGSRVSAAVAQAMATAYDTDIYPKMKAVFSIDNISYQGYRFRDSMELADAFGDEDGALCILLLDIRDGYNPSTSPGYVGGYFSTINFRNNSSLPQNQRYSNESDMIYVDINPSTPGSDESNETLAHELQHLINFVNDQAIREGNPTDVWLNEGLSSAAEWVYTGTPDASRLAWYNMATTANGSQISTGNTFFVWDQYGNDSVLDDYATVNLFFQWLRLQSGGSSNVYRTISRSSHNDYNAVVGAMNGYNDWPTMLKTWLAANYINAPNGRYGYMNDNVLVNVKARTAPSGTRSVNLYPGEGVYSVTASSGSTPNQGRNIRYAGLNKTSGDVNDTATFASGALLTYNVDTNQDSRPEAGTTTGVAASVDAVPESLSVRAARSRPFKIGAGDMLRRNGYEEETLPPLRLYPGNKGN